MVSTKDNDGTNGHSNAVTVQTNESIPTTEARGRKRKVVGGDGMDTEGRSGEEEAQTSIASSLEDNFNATATSKVTAGSDAQERIQSHSSVHEGGHKRKKHKRFTDEGDGDAEELKLLEQTRKNVVQGAAEDNNTKEREVDDDEDDDEAPDTVTAAAGLQASRTAVAKAAEAVQRTKAERRAKRKEHAILLEAQAAPSKRRSKHRSVSPKNPIDDTSSSKRKSKKSRKEPLPEYLPEEVLATEPIYDLALTTTTTSPAPRTQRPIQNKKILLSQSESKPPKDVKKGSKRIRVLPSQHEFLPPKSKESRTRGTREAWLIGKRGPGGKYTAPRTPWKNGFLVK